MTPTEAEIAKHRRTGNWNVPYRHLHIPVLRRIQPVARFKDWQDRRAHRDWYSPSGTYDGLEASRPYRHLRCHRCGGAHGVCR